ncbi:MAG: family hydrolase [Acidobacteria bacterium]|nr:family hydrolase [Acidobacteriota bacterium]
MSDIVDVKVVEADGLMNSQESVNVTEAKLVVFDMAGTTVKDHGQVPAAFAAALTDHHIEFTAEQIRNVRGSSKRQAVLDLLPESPDRLRRADLVYDSFREYLARKYSVDGVEPIEDAERVFKELRREGIHVALNTGFDRDITELLLKALNWQNQTVDGVVCADDVRQGRPAPFMIFRAMELTGTTNMRHVANVGDTVLDLEAGHNARVRWNAGVLTGAHDRSRLAQAPHTHLLSSIAELPGLLINK